MNLGYFKKCELRKFTHLLIALFFWNSRSPWTLPRCNSSWYNLPLSKGTRFQNHSELKVTIQVISFKLYQLYRWKANYTGEEGSWFTSSMKANTYKKQNRTVNYPATCKKKFQLGLSVESSCSVHAFPWTFLAEVFLSILESLVIYLLSLLPLRVILLCCVNSNIAPLSGSYLAGWNGDSSVRLNPSVKTGGGWLHTDSLIYLQPLQSSEWKLGEYWERQCANKPILDTLERPPQWADTPVSHHRIILAPFLQQLVLALLETLHRCKCCADLHQKRNFYTHQILREFESQKCQLAAISKSNECLVLKYLFRLWTSHCRCDLSLHTTCWSQCPKNCKGKDIVLFCVFELPLSPAVTLPAVQVPGNRLECENLPHACTPQSPAQG